MIALFFPLALRRHEPRDIRSLTENPQ